MAHCGGKKLPRSLPFPLNRDEGDEQFTLKRYRFNYKFNTNVDFFKDYLIQHMLIKQIQDLQFIIIKVNEKEIIYQLLLFI